MVASAMALWCNCVAIPMRLRYHVAHGKSNSGHDHVPAGSGCGALCARAKRRRRPRRGEWDHHAASARRAGKDPPGTLGQDARRRRTTREHAPESYPRGTPERACGVAWRGIGRWEVIIVKHIPIRHDNNPDGRCAYCGWRRAGEWRYSPRGARVGWEESQRCFLGANSSRGRDENIVMRYYNLVRSTGQDPPLPPDDAQDRVEGGVK